MSSPSTETKRPGFRKRMLFRMLAVLVGLSPLIGLEIVCRACGWGLATSYDDPHVGFSSIHPLFVLNEETGRYEIPHSRQSHFRPASFPAKRSNNTRRIFVLGGSTVQGRPYANETAFPAWLELSLQAADPAHDWQVVNCGGVSYASYRLVPILEEVLHYQPDAIIVCTGHNEFLEERTYGEIKHKNTALAWPERQIARLRTYNVLRAGVHALLDEPEQSPATTLGPEVDARLDWRGGLKKYHRDDAWKQNVIEHFDFNVRRLIAIAGRARVPIFMVAPVSNLDWPAFKSEHRDDLKPEELQQFDELVAQARSLYQTDLDEAAELLRHARDLDDRYALLQFELGKCLQQQGQFESARAAFEKGIDEDICPLRMLAVMRQRMQQTAQDTGTPYLDAHAYFTERSPGGITGSKWLLDHVHPTIPGHQEIAGHLLELLAGQKLFTLAANWKQAEETAYAGHLASLEPTYFARGRERLKGLMRWASGKVKREKKASN